MCGRFSLTNDADQLPSLIRQRMSAHHLSRYAARSLIRPTEPVLGLRRNQSNMEAALMLWGLIPSWSKTPCAGPRPIHARSETVTQQAVFKGAWRHRRCLIPATAFFEKQHGICRLDQASFWLAGLWERWHGSDGSEIDTCAILTTSANALIKPIHDRMPVIIPNGLEESWLSQTGGTELRALEPLLSGWDSQGWIINSFKSAQQTPKESTVQASLFDVSNF